MNNYKDKPGSLPRHFTMHSFAVECCGDHRHSFRIHFGRFPYDLVEDGKPTCNDTAILQDAGGKEETELFLQRILVFSCVFLSYSIPC